MNLNFTKNLSNLSSVHKINVFILLCLVALKFAMFLFKIRYAMKRFKTKSR